MDGQYYNLIYQGLQNVVALDFDITEQRLYFIDVQAQKLQRVFMNGTGFETLVWHSMPGAEGIAVDWIGRSQHLSNKYNNTSWHNTFT